jgi:hemoglobin
MRDIETRADIDLVMRSFYTKAFADDRIGFYFTEIAGVQLEHHLVTIGNFWESVLFNKAVYEGNPIAVHQYLNRQSAFSGAHFNRWLELFTASVDSLFSGETAERMKQRALSIATIMKIKLVHGGIMPGGH